MIEWKWNDWRIAVFNMIYLDEWFYVSTPPHQDDILKSHTYLKIIWKKSHILFIHVNYLSYHAWLDINNNDELEIHNTFFYFTHMLRLLLIEN